MDMTKITSVLTVVLCGLAGSGCGSDPYVGDSSSTKTDTATSTGTHDPTTTSTSTDTGNRTMTITTTTTTEGTATRTSPPTGTYTVTVTTTATMTMVEEVQKPDAGAPDAVVEDPTYPNIYVRVSPQRLLDMVVMIDNSPSMAPKVGKLNAQFSKLLGALKDPMDGTLPDLRLAIIDSDLGTGCAYSVGSCGPKDPANAQGCWGDQGKFQMISYPSNGCTFNAGAQYLEVKMGSPVNYAGDIGTVFACLAAGLGTVGCGFEHQLQAFEFAIAAEGVGTEEQQLGFLRSNADLGLLFLTDEDDCSGALNTGFFGDQPALRGESASLRCATRGHSCGGQNLSESGPGFPTGASYTHPFADCRARLDTCPNQTDGYEENTDATGPTACAPLKNLHHLAEELKAIRSDPRMVFVAGIFGWPLSAADMATAQYKIAPVPNPNIADTMHPTIYDYWPICYDPNHLPTAATTDPATGFDGTAAGWGATGGLRESAFIDEFGDRGMKFSICQPDFSNTLNTIGSALANRMQDLCVDYKLVDTDNDPANGLQSNCRVAWQRPLPDPSDPTKVIWEDSAGLIPQCQPGSTNGNVAQDCWQLIRDTNRCPLTGQVLSILRTAEEILADPQLPAGTRVHMQCHVCQAGSTDPGCAYAL